MDIDAYWQLVDEARARVSGGAGSPDGEAPDGDDVAVALTALLVERGPDAAAAADLAYRRLVAAVYGWPLWGAAYLIGGGCSDDGFEYFRGWLVAQGREVFERAVADPDSLADVVDEDTDAEAEDMLGAAWRAYEELTGGGVPDVERVPQPELGESWDFDDDVEMRARYPRLAAVYLDA
jgi:hypothetical protein